VGLLISLDKPHLRLLEVVAELSRASLARKANT
jgi:hypothetical protein